MIDLKIENEVEFFLFKRKIPTYIKVDDALTNLTVRYNSTVGLVEIMESSITTTITRYYRCTGGCG